MNRPSSTAPISIEEARAILSLRLLIARAANKDSLSWWDDESLTAPAQFLLERVIPVAPSAAARSLALHAARARHQAACPTDAMLHLYRLDSDDQDELVVRFMPLHELPVPEAPITTMGSLRAHLLTLAGEPAAYTIARRTDTHRLHVEIPPAPPGASPMLHRARTLAWAYLEGAPGQPVFPYFTE